MVEVSFTIFFLPFHGPGWWYHCILCAHNAHKFSKCLTIWLVATYWWVSLAASGIASQLHESNATSLLSTQEYKSRIFFLFFFRMTKWHCAFSCGGSFFFSLSICTYTLYEGNNVIKCRILQLGACSCSFLHIPCFSFAASSCFASDSRTTFCYAARRFLALSPSFFNVFYKVSRSIPLTKISTLVSCEQRVRHIPFVHKWKKKKSYEKNTNNARMQSSRSSCRWNSSCASLPFLNTWLWLVNVVALNQEAEGGLITLQNGSVRCTTLFAGSEICLLISTTYFHSWALSASVLTLSRTSPHGRASSTAELLQ